MGLRLHVWRSATFRFLRLPLCGGAPGGEEHPAGQHQSKRDPPQVQGRAPVSPQQEGSLQRLAGVMARPGRGDQQQNSWHHKQGTRENFDLASLWEPDQPGSSYRRCKAPHSDSRHDEGSPRPEASREGHERLVEGAVQAAVLSQIPVIPLQPHPVPVSRQGGGGVVHGAAYLPQGQAAGQNRAKPPGEAHSEGSQLQLPLHGSGRPRPPPQRRPQECSGRGVVIASTCEAEGLSVCARLFRVEEPVLCYLEKKAAAAAGWRREIPLHGFKTIPSHSLHAEAKKTKPALCSPLRHRAFILSGNALLSVRPCWKVKGESRLWKHEFKQVWNPSLHVSFTCRADGFRLDWDQLWKCL